MLFSKIYALLPALHWAIVYHEERKLPFGVVQQRWLDIEFIYKQYT